MPNNDEVMLHEHEQAGLIRAIEAAMDIGSQQHFDAWIGGPFGQLVPHEMAVCLGLGRGGDPHQIHFVRHNLVDTATMDLLCHPEGGLAVRLAQSLAGGPQLIAAIDAPALAAMLNESRGVCRDAGEPQHMALHNAIVHRLRLLSGAIYFIVLVNVPVGRIPRILQVLKLVSAHLKMALSCAIAAARDEQPALTPREAEILRWMAAGKSNREIGSLLGISVLTLKQHINRLYRKLDVQNRADAVARGGTLAAAGKTAM